jgi:beta-lactamase regulating signal transducer with metallopeptidase domain/tetratricopeptide (TPR) repeat protein
MPRQAAYSAPALASAFDETQIEVDASVPNVSTSISPAAPIKPRLALPACLFLAWLSVACGVGIWVTRRLRGIAGMIRQSVEAPEEARALLESARRQLGIKAAVPLRCADIGSPAICGVFRPVILIPRRLVDNLGVSELRSVLLHELAHYKRGDLWVSHAQILLQIFYWHNPLLWLANARIRRAREQAVDEMVLVEMGLEAPDYPMTLVRVAKLGLARPRAAIGLMGILEPGRGLTQRIFHIMNRPFPRSARIGAPGLAAVLLLALVALPMACRSIKTEAAISSATGTAASSNMTVRISKDGAITLQNQPVTPDQLRTNLAEAVRANPDASLTIQADQKASWDSVNKVIEAANVAHINKTNTTARSPSRVDWSANRLRSPGFMLQIGTLSAEELKALEARWADDPDDFSAWRDLLFHYNHSDRAAKATHLLWTIEHHPEFWDQGPEMMLDPITGASAYQKGKTLWLKQVEDHPTDARILGNAATFFTLHDHATAERLLTKAQLLEPKNSVWPERLGHLYELELAGRSDTNLAAKALAQFEKAQALTSPAVPGSPVLADLAKMALVAGDLGKARDYANELLGPGMQWSNGGNAGSALYQGHTVLGRVALREEKLDEAKQHLLESAKTKGSPTLNSFGPNMALAKELLEKGQTNAVLEFFQACENFWPKYGGEDKLAKWSDEVKAGKTPDFGANLAY